VAHAAKTADLTTVDQLAERVGRVRARRADLGRGGPFDVCCGPFRANDFSTDGVHDAEAVDEFSQLATAGVSWTTVTLGGDSVEELCERIAAFAERIATPVRASLGH
jgi:hypothetical protein